jgi:NADPH-dependent 2,4-dienoyl-CoA reductase/sulfur reductase-like enzyme
MVAGYAAKQLVELGLRPGELAIVSTDTSVPYERPPLSKGFLAGRDSEESIRINPEDFYRQHGIELRLGCRVTRVDTERKRLALDHGGEFHFDKLVLATGARVRKLNIPGADSGNVLYLRSLEDSKAIQKQIGAVKQAVVIGSGFIGMEVASVLAQKGIDVTMILRDDRIWKKFFTPQMSNAFETYYQARRVRFAKNATIKQLRGDRTVDSVVLGDGQSIAAQLVVVGVGVQPVTDFLAGSGIETGDGVMVNEFLETNVPGIFAAGDVANYQDILFQKRRRVEHWDNAVSQGQYCARALMGERTPFRHVPYFFSDVFDLSYEFWGDTEGADATVHRGDLSGTSFSVWWLRQGVVIAAFTMNRPDEERNAAPKWIESKQRVSAEKLGKEASSVQAAALV